MLGTVIKVASIPIAIAFASYRTFIWHRASVLNNLTNKHFIVNKITGQRIKPSKHVYIQPWTSEYIEQIRDTAQRLPEFDNDSIYEIQFDVYRLFPFMRTLREDQTGCLWVWDKSSRYFRTLEKAEESRVFKNSKEGISCDDWNSS